MQIRNRLPHLTTLTIASCSITCITGRPQSKSCELACKFELRHSVTKFTGASRSIHSCHGLDSHVSRQCVRDLLFRASALPVCPAQDFARPASTWQVPEVTKGVRGRPLPALPVLAVAAGAAWPRVLAPSLPSPPSPPQMRTKDRNKAQLPPFLPPNPSPSPSPPHTTHRVSPSPHPTTPPSLARDQAPRPAAFVPMIQCACSNRSQMTSAPSLPIAFSNTIVHHATHETQHHWLCPVPASNHPLAASHLNPTLYDGALSEELVSDIQQQGGQIRRECLSKRVKQAEEVPRVLVGNLIGEGCFDVQHAYMHPYCCN